MVSGAVKAVLKGKPGPKTKDKKEEVPGFSDLLEKSWGGAAVPELSANGGALSGGLAAGAKAAGTARLAGLEMAGPYGQQRSRAFVNGASNAPEAGAVNGLPNGLTGQAARAGVKDGRLNGGLNSSLNGSQLNGRANLAGTVAATAKEAAGPALAPEVLTEAEKARKQTGQEAAGKAIKPSFQAESGQQLHLTGAKEQEEPEQPLSVTAQEPKVDTESGRKPEQGQKTDEADEKQSLGKTDQSQMVMAQKEAEPSGGREAAVIRIKVAEPYHQVNPEFSEKLKDSMVSQMKAGVQRYEIQLEPEHLGKVTVQISVAKGQAVVELSCASHRTAELLSENARTIGALMEHHSQEPIFVEVRQEAKPDWFQQGSQNQGQGREQSQDESRGKREKERNESGDFMEQLRLGLINL